VDLYHAREHLHALTRSLEFMLGDRRDEWLAARLNDLDHGDIDSIEAAVRKYPLEGVREDETGRELGYFLTNAPRMRYHWFRSRGLFAGSGVAEASCKTIVAQRLKNSGMRWTVAGADAIIALRCREASSQWEPSAGRRATRQEPPDQPAPEDELSHRDKHPLAVGAAHLLGPHVRAPLTGPVSI
jgi:hypothetical protein